MSLLLSNPCGLGDCDACDGVFVALFLPPDRAPLGRPLALVHCDHAHHLLGSFCDLCRGDLATAEGRWWLCPGCQREVPLHHACLDNWYPGPRACHACTFALPGPAGRA